MRYVCAPAGPSLVAGVSRHRTLGREYGVGRFGVAQLGRYDAIVVVVGVLGDVTRVFAQLGV
jgi:hypothetical protein